MSTPTIVIHGPNHKNRLLGFVKLAKPRSATISFDGKYPTWLLKSAVEDGKTIAKIIDASGNRAVHDMITDAVDKEANPSLIAPPAKKKGKTA